MLYLKKVEFYIVCGISGVLQLKNNSSKINLDEIKILTDKLINSVKLRGPDNTGMVRVSNGFIGHTRLAIRDLRSSSNQPVLIKNSNSSFVYNGEIYNENELINKYDLEKTSSDTLCLKSLFEKTGDLSFLNDLVGDFAIGYWDDRLGKLFLIRDQIGKKPLYYALFNNYFLFNSSIKGIQDVIKSKTINNEGLTNYLVYGNMFSKDTIFQEINQVMPGSIIVWDSNTGEISNQKYFNFKDQIIQSHYLKASYKDLKNMLSETLEKVIESHLISDVPISLLLSSGIDSKLVAKYSLNHDIKAYTADFKENYKEVSDARDFSNYYEELEHEIVNIKESNIFKILEKITEFIGEPFGDASIIPLYFLYSNLPKRSKVVLQGDGGDELFGGYTRYQSFNFLSKFPNNKLLYHSSKFFNLKHRLQRLIFLSSLDNEELYKNIMTTDFENFNTLSFFENYFENEKINFREIAGNQYCSEFLKYQNLNLSEQISSIDFMNQLPNQFLYKVDRISMMCGIEARVPLVDIRLIKFIFSIEPRYRFKYNPRKKFLRDSIDIPKQFKYTPKRGFGTPISKWMHNSKDYLRENILSDSFIEFFMIDKSNIVSLINMNKYSPSQSYSLWKILCLSIWFRKVFKK